MGLLFAEDPHFNENERQTGFYRYRQLLSARFGRWWRTNLLTLAGLAPLAAGVFYSVAFSSVLVLLPASLLGGMIAGPFLAGMYDAILRGLRDDPRPWWDSYKLSWKQNWKGSLLPGALFGLVLGVYAFMAMLFWWAEQAPSLGTVALYLFALLVVLIVDAVLTIRHLALVSRLVVGVTTLGKELQVQLSLGKAELSDMLEDKSAALRQRYSAEIAQLERYSRRFRSRYSKLSVNRRYTVRHEDILAAAQLAREELLRKKAQRKASR